MTILYEHDTDEIIAALMAGKVMVLRTDTLYGLVCRADMPASVERIYAIKGRDGEKSPIVLIATRDQLFNNQSSHIESFLDTVWPGKVSVIIAAPDAPQWIERGNGTVAYRQPDSDWLRSIIARTSSLIAPSANPQGQHPAGTIEQAIAYFGDSVDIYVDGGEVTSKTPSQLLWVLADGQVERLR